MASSAGRILRLPFGFDDIPPIRLAMFLALAAMIAIAYYPAVSGAYIWDDAAFLDAKAIASPTGIFTIWFDPRKLTGEGHYWPITYSTFWLENRIWGYNSLGSHIINLLLHFTNTVLVWRLLQRLEVPAAWLGAAVFALHPVHVEAVAWIIVRKDLLATMFYLLGLLTWLQYRQRPRRGLYWRVLGFYAAAMLCKSIAVTLPAALLVMDWWKQDRMRGADFFRVMPLAIGGLLFTFFDLEYYYLKESASFDFALLERLLIIARAYWFYPAKFLWPADLIFVYPLWKIDAAALAGYAYVLAGIAALAVLWVLRHRIPRPWLASLAFFTVTISPVLGFFDYGYMEFAYVADRYQYLASIGLIAGCLCIAGWILERLPSPARLGSLAAAGLLLAGYGYLSWQHAENLKTATTFFSAVAEDNPEAYAVHLNLSSALSKEGRYEEAIETGLRAVQQDPESDGAYYNLGGAYLLTEQWEKAIEAYRKAAEFDPLPIKPYMQLGAMLMKVERYDEAAKALRTTLKLDPEAGDAKLNLAEIYRHQGRHAEALKLYESAMRHGKALVRIHFHMADIYIKTKRYEEAAESLEQVLRLDPNHEQARQGLTTLRQALNATGG